MKNANRGRIIGFDFFKTKAEKNLMVSFKPIGSVGMESNIPGVDIAVNNLSASQYRDLKQGMAYVEFWIEAIDHTKPTANNRLYGQEEFIKGMDRLLHRVISNGGMQPGEHEHPAIIYDSTKSKEDNMSRIADRLCRFDTKNISHYIVDTKTENGKTFFLIRTNPSNPVIVNDMSIGKIPTFSIRTLGDFPLINGVNVGKNLLVISADYVYNPANSNSRALMGSNMKFVDPINSTVVNIELTTKVGNESVELLLIGADEELVVGIESDNSITMNVISKHKERTLSDITNEVFRSIF